MSSQLEQAIKIDAQAEKALLRPDAQLDYAMSNSADEGLPAITVTPLAGQYLSIQCQLIGAKNVLEIGTLGGYSTLCFAKAGAKVTSIEISEKHRAVALENTKAYADQIDIILGAALDVLPKLAKEGRQFDFVFIDADWGEQFEYFQWAMKLTRPKGAIFVDNAIRAILYNGDDRKEESLLTKVGRESGVTATLVPTLSGQHGRVEDMADGFLLVIVHGA